MTGVPVLAGDLTDVAGRLDAAAAAGRGGGDGARARAAVPVAAAAAAAGAGAVRGGDRLRRAGAARVAADDGLDRGAARAAGVGGRLRDPVPGAGARVGGPSIATAALATAVGFLVLLLSPVPMVRGFGALLVVGVGVSLVVALTAGTAVLVLARRRRASDGPVARSLRGAGDLVDGAAQARRAGAAAGRRARPSGCSARRVPSPGARARRRRSSLAVVRLGAGLADRGRLRPAAARPAGPRGGARPRRAAARHRVSRVRSTCSSRRADLTDPKVVAWMRDYQNEVLMRHGYSAREGLRGRRAVPGALAAGPVPHARAVGDARADPGAAGRRPGVLLAGRDHAGPQHRGARLRHPAAVARAAARGDAGHARAARPAGRA